MSVDTITSIDQFNTISASGKVIVKFFADWCGPCKMISPTFKEEAAKHADIKFVEVNAEDLEEIFEKYDGSTLPYFVFLKDGEKVDSFLGNRKENLIKKIDDFSA